MYNSQNRYNRCTVEGNGSSQEHNLALTGLSVPKSLDSRLKANEDYKTYRAHPCSPSPPCGEPIQDPVLTFSRTEPLLECLPWWSGVQGLKFRVKGEG